jgi:hypothetical protein
MPRVRRRECVLPDERLSRGVRGLAQRATRSPLWRRYRIRSSSYSNYYGLVVRVNHSFSKGLLFQINYSWSHALDVCSNGCIGPFNYDTDESILSPQNPFNARANYGNADYDVRHYFSANYVWDDVIPRFSHWGPNPIFGGWTISGTWFARSGFPFTVVDTAASSTLSGFNDGGPYFGNLIGSGVGSCGEAAAGPSATPCLNAGEFSPSTSSPTSFGNQGRNAFRGPRYFNTDLAISQSFHFPRWESAKLTIGAQAFNLFNHPNFDLPVNDLSNTNPTTGFGDVTRTVNPPTSLLGVVPGRRRLDAHDTGEAASSSSRPFRYRQPKRRARCPALFLFAVI